MAEKNILAYFNTPEQAQGAAAKLHALRVADLSIDRFSTGPGEEMGGMTNAIGGGLSSLNAYTPNAALSSLSAGILGAAGPSESGMSASEQDGLRGRDILLTVVVDESVHHQALKIVEEAGGYV